MASTIWIWLPLRTKRKVTRFYDVKQDLKILSKICGLHIRKHSFRLWSLPAVLRSICKQESPDKRLTIPSSIALIYVFLKRVGQPKIFKSLRQSEIAFKMFLTYCLKSLKMLSNFLSTHILWGKISYCSFFCSFLTLWLFFSFFP